MRVARVLAVVVVVAVAASMAVPFLAWRLETSLIRSLRAESVDVRLVGGPVALVRGRFPRAGLLVRRAPAGDLTVDELDARLDGLRLALTQAVLLGRFIVRDLDSGRIVMRVRDDDFRASLEHRRYVEGARVRFDNGSATIAGTVTVAGARVQMELDGDVIIRDGRELVLRVRALRAAEMHLPAGVANLLVAPLNPLLAADRLPIRLRFTDVTLDDGVMTITADAR